MPFIITFADQETSYCSQISNLMKIVFLFLFSFICSQVVQAQKTGILFADSEMKRFPEAWQLDHGKRLYFGYAQGVGCTAMLLAWKETGDRKYLDYVEQWADTIINEKGEIHLYKQET